MFINVPVGVWMNVLLRDALVVHVGNAYYDRSITIVVGVLLWDEMPLC